MGRRSAGAATGAKKLHIPHVRPTPQLWQKFQSWLPLTFLERRRAEKLWCCRLPAERGDTRPTSDVVGRVSCRHAARPADAAPAAEPRPSVPSISVWRGGRQHALQNGGRGQQPISSPTAVHGPLSTPVHPKLSGQLRRRAPLHAAAHAGRTHCWVQASTRSF